MSRAPGESTAGDEAEGDRAAASDHSVIAGERHPSEDAPAPRTRPRRTAAAMIAAGMLGLDEALGRKPREEAPIIVDANGDPVDIDSDGIEVRVPSPDGGEVAVASAALPRTRPLVRPSTGRRRRGRVV